MTETAVPASLVKELREKTGAGMMDCKRALAETGGDVEAARKLLRERGIATAGKLASRETTEGVVLVAADETRAAGVAVGCNTEPVSKNDDFRAFAVKALQAVERDGPTAVAGLEDERVELAGKLGENVRVVAAVRVEAGEGEVIGSYVHTPANKLGAVVRLRGGTPELAREVAMHITFGRPAYAAREQVPAEEVEEERGILERQEDVASKPEQVRGKIVEGRLEKWYGERVLVDQPWYREQSRKVRDELGGAEVVEFALLSVTG